MTSYNYIHLHGTNYLIIILEAIYMWWSTLPSKSHEYQYVGHEYYYVVHLG